ncbi:MAG: hypothetical protein WA185_11020 [Candidatus Acidiferrales bacterium]
MKASPQVRRMVIVLCVAGLLLAALTPGVAGLALAVLVITSWFFVAFALTVILACVDEESRAPKALASPAFSPRPPPIR